ncbi:MAG TPA: hypothetical protein VG265_13875 [Gaiellaceae bacterium]|jgi:hypothetical protein|nr:hypothetical protein [Gaiellaceae bacterium]
MTGSWPPHSPPLTLERRALETAELVRLRLPDRPGSLAAVLAHLAEHGVDVMRLEVLDREAGHAVDDLLLSGPALENALASLGSRAMVLARRPGIDLRDGSLAMASACEAVAAAPSPREAHRRIVRAAIGLVFAEAGLLLARREGFLVVLASTAGELPEGLDGSGPSLISSALFSGECLTADGRIPWAPPALRDKLPGGTVAVVPNTSPHEVVLVLVRDDHAPFLPSELERLRGLMRVAGYALGLHSNERPRALREAR